MLSEGWDVCKTLSWKPWGAVARETQPSLLHIRQGSLCSPTLLYHLQPSELIGRPASRVRHLRSLLTNHATDGGYLCPGPVQPVWACCEQSLAGCLPCVVVPYLDQTWLEVRGASNGWWSLVLIDEPVGRQRDVLLAWVLLGPWRPGCHQGCWAEFQDLVGPLQDVGLDAPLGCSQNR